jgi:hypothetical protein
MGTLCMMENIDLCKPVMINSIAIIYQNIK